MLYIKYNYLFEVSVFLLFLVSSAFSCFSFFLLSLSPFFSVPLLVVVGKVTLDLSSSESLFNVEKVSMSLSLYYIIMLGTLIIIP